MRINNSGGYTISSCGPIVLMALLSGCASISYKEVQINSRIPADAIVCAAPSKDRLQVIPVGSACVTQIRAKLRLTRVPVEVRKNQQYRVTMLKDQFWFDSTHRIDNEAGFPGTRLMNLFGFLKREPSDWMAMHAAIVNPQNGRETVLSKAAFANKLLTVESDGQLGFFPNDARLEYFYSNNNGHVWMEIQRLPDRAPGEVVEKAAGEAGLYESQGRSSP